MNCIARIRRQTSYVLHDDFTQAVFTVLYIMRRAASEIITGQDDIVNSEGL